MSIYHNFILHFICSINLVVCNEHVIFKPEKTIKLTRKTSYLIKQGYLWEHTVLIKRNVACQRILRNINKTEMFAVTRMMEIVYLQ